jgi:hypothetical protein
MLLTVTFWRSCSFGEVIFVGTVSGVAIAWVRAVFLTN